MNNGVNIHKYNIVLIADEPWENFTWRRRHYVAWALSKNHKVVFVEPPLSLFSILKNRTINWKQIFNLGRCKHQGRKLYSYSPYKLLPLSFPFSNLLKFDSINKQIIFNQLKRYSNKLKIRGPILWVFFSDKQYEYYDSLEPILTVGDIYDKIAPSWEGMQYKDIQRLERMQAKIIENSDVIFTVSQLLYDELTTLHKNTYLVQNGVDYESFENASKSNCIIDDVKQLKKPILAFLGMMHYIVDFELLNYVAESHPEWTLLLMGKENISSKHDKFNFESLVDKSNVVYVDELERQLIPFYLQAADICLMPMKKMELNRYANPLKMWEYLAAGKPIVATDQGCDYGLGDLIRLARNKQEFLIAIEEALITANDIDLINKRKEFAKNNSWINRTDRMLKIIEEKLDRPSITNS